MMNTANTTCIMHIIGYDVPGASGTNHKELFPRTNQYLL